MADIPMTTAVITVSTSVAAGEGEDESGPKLAALLAEAGCEIAGIDVVPDEREAIEKRLRELVAQDVRFIFTTGGTGLTPDDVTPEATDAVIERRADGFQQAMLAEGLKHQRLALLTRGVSGIAGRTLIVNLPGNPKAIDQLVPVLAPSLHHAADSLVRSWGDDGP